MEPLLIEIMKHLNAKVGLNNDEVKAWDEKLQSLTNQIPDENAYKNLRVALRNIGKALIVVGGVAATSAVMFAAFLFAAGTLGMGAPGAATAIVATGALFVMAYYQLDRNRLANKQREAGIELKKTLIEMKSSEPKTNQPDADKNKEVKNEPEITSRSPKQN